MNDARIDRIFQEKLVSFEIQPSSEAWEKFNDRLIEKRKKKRFRLLAVAASWIVLLSAVFVLIRMDSRSDAVITAENQSVQADHPQTNPEKKETLIQTISEEQTEILAEVKDTGKSENNSIDIMINKVVQVEKPEQENPQPEISLEATSAIIVVLERHGPAFSSSLKEFQPEMQILQEADIDPLLSPNESGIKKAYDYALRLKNGEENLINLRKAKEDLFAMARNLKLNQSKPN